MDGALMFMLLWFLAFVTLCASVLLLNIYYSAIGNDLCLRTLGQEALIASLGSLVEGAGAWAVISLLPAAGRAMAVPAILVAILYKITHLEDWTRYDLILLILFQAVIGSVGGMLFLGHFEGALIVLGVFGGFLAVLASVVRSL